MAGVPESRGFNMLQKLKSKWFKSKVYKLIEKMIRNHYRRKVKSDDFTILCSNCVGGCIYHRLGRQFLSPTVNLYIDQSEFVQFCVHLDEYLDAELSFVESETAYPVGKLIHDGLPEITLNFIHYNTPEEAEEKWNIRKARINKNNLYIIMFNIGNVTEEELHLLDGYKCSNKVLINWKEMPEIPWSVYVPLKKDDDLMQRNVFGLRTYERKWDFVSFLNNTGS